MGYMIILFFYVLILFCLVSVCRWFICWACWVCLVSVCRWACRLVGRVVLSVCACLVLLVWLVFSVGLVVLFLFPFSGLWLLVFSVSFFGLVLWRCLVVLFVLFFRSLSVSSCGLFVGSPLALVLFLFGVVSLSLSVRVLMSFFCLLSVSFFGVLFVSVFLSFLFPLFGWSFLVLFASSFGRPLGGLSSPFFRASVVLFWRSVVV